VGNLRRLALPERIEDWSLSSLKQGVVYVKGDARVPYQKILTVLDALEGRSVLLLTAPVNVPPLSLVDRKPLVY